MAQTILGRFGAKVRECSSVEPELVIREGTRAEEVRQIIEDDEDIAVLVLGASEASEGPGPLVAAIAGKGAGTFPIPITIVPQTISDDEMDAIA